MKKCLVTIILSLLAFVQNADFAMAAEQAPVEMVSYEQSWLDDKGTLALKNNTSEDIHDLTFILEYLDMNGTPMDYKTFTYDIDIAPGMTKKLDIPAYEHDRHYQYYKTKGGYGNPNFKVRYKLESFNTPEIDKSDKQVTSNYTNGSDDDIMSLIIYLAVLLIFIGIYVGSYVLVAVMAQRRNRNPVVWLLLSFIATPILMCIILLIIGKNNIPEY